jgi:tetraacyldisaccharide 4'-kinase
MTERRLVERIWFGDDSIAGAARLGLAPLELMYAGGVALRGALYDAGVLPSHEPRIPAVSVGNLTVGGTGKTPVAAWLACELAARGARPAIVLRGYGDDEPLVHRRLNPALPVIASPDRLAGIERAAAEGADLAVLDDAFQHRRARRVADIVLLSADRWPRARRLLPAGPWREPLRAVRRASLAIVTRKACTREQAGEVREALLRVAPAVPVAIGHLALGELRRVDEVPVDSAPTSLRDALSDAPAGSTASRPLASLAGERVLAISAVGDAGAFAAQVAALGATVRAASFPDHHRFTRAEAEQLAREVSAKERAVCTLKDAVKLAPLWPREAPALWYVSQQLLVDSGRGAIEALLTALLAARHHQP